MKPVLSTPRRNGLHVRDHFGPRRRLRDGRNALAPYPEGAFSLLELLIVIGIIVALTALIAPVTNSMMRGNQLTTSGQSLVNQLSLARQAALTDGHAVQVRLYKLPDHNKADGTPSVYRAIQCFSEGDPVMAGGVPTAPLKPLTAPLLFAAPVIVLDSKVQSSLLNIPASSPGAQQPGVSTYGTNYQYISFRFKPDGQVDIPAEATGLTLVLQNDASTPGALPANFCSVEIDPRTGAVRAFRP
jgi:uncharacterized protein (TIGR02596 family)